MKEKGLSRNLCKYNFLREHNSVSKDNGKLIKGSPPVAYRLSPFLADLVNRKIHYLVDRLIILLIRYLSLPSVRCQSPKKT